MNRLSLAKPHMLILTGIPSSGKSYFADKFSETFGAASMSYYQLQQIIGDAAKTEQATDYMLHELMKSRQSLLVEGKADTKRDRQALAKLAQENGYEPLFIWVQTDPATARVRASRGGKTKTNRVMSADDHESSVKRFTPLTATETHVVISGKHTYATQAKVVLKKLSAAHSERVERQRPPERPSAPEAGDRRNITVG